MIDYTGFSKEEALMARALHDQVYDLALTSSWMNPTCAAHIMSASIIKYLTEQEEL
jgi:hypothetical protein